MSMHFSSCSQDLWFVKGFHCTNGMRQYEIKHFGHARDINIRLYISVVMVTDVRHATDFIHTVPCHCHFAINIMFVKPKYFWMMFDYIS